MASLGVVVTFGGLCAAIDGVIPEVLIAPNISMPAFAYGTLKESHRTCSVEQGIEQWLRLGGRHLDTAFWYHNLRTVGSVIKASGIPRESLFLTTKIEGPIGYHPTLREFSGDLQRVGVDYFDLVIMHWPCPSWPADFPNKCGEKHKEERLATWRAMEHLKHTGKARAIGVSNFALVQIHQLIDAGYHPAVNQVQWNLGYHDDALLRSMNELDIKVEAWASLGGPSARAWTPFDHITDPQFLSDPRVLSVANRYNRSSAQVALQWMIGKGVIPVTATCSESHAKQNMEVFDFSLSDSDVLYLDSLQEESSETILM